MNFICFMCSELESVGKSLLGKQHDAVHFFVGSVYPDSKVKFISEYPVHKYNTNLQKRNAKNRSEENRIELVKHL